MSSEYSPCSNQNRGCGKQCQDVNCEVDSRDRSKSIRFFLVVGVLTSLVVALFVIFACIFPGAVFSALAAFLWVLGACLLGKDLP